MKNTKEAFVWIIKILNENNIKYRISGGLAARAYGSKRILADIDIEVLSKNINKIYKITEKFCITTPHLYKDENWQLILMTLRYKKQEIDIAAFESKIFNKKTKRWVKKPGNFNDVNLIKIFNIESFVETRDSLIEYKQILSRDVDIRDIEQLKNID